MFFLGVITGFVLGRIATSIGVRYRLGKGIMELGTHIKDKN